MSDLASDLYRHELRQKQENNRRTGYFIKRMNVTADRDVTIIGKRFTCGEAAEPYGSVLHAKSAAKLQEVQDQTYCPECHITYEIVRADEINLVN